MIYERLICRMVRYLLVTMPVNGFIKIFRRFFCMAMLFNKIKSIFLMAILLLLFTTTAYCATYYVDKAGSDSDGKGTSALPWKSIVHALKQAGYGDLVSINDGIYSEDQLIVPPGVSMTSTSKQNSKVRVQPKRSLGAYSPFVKLSSDKPGSNGDQSISHIEFDGINGSTVARAGILVQNRNNVRIHDCDIHDFKGANGSYGVQPISTQIPRSIKWWEFIPSDMQTPSNNSNLNALWPANPIVNFELDHNTITNCGHRDSLSSGIIYGSVYPYHLKDSSIHDNDIDAVGSKTQCIKATSALLWNVDIYNNKLSMARYTDRSSYIIELWLLRNGCEIFNNAANAGFSLAYGKESQVYRNEIIFDPVVKSGANMGIEFIGQGEGEVFENLISGAGVYGIDAGLDKNAQSKDHILRNTTIRNNVVHNTQGAGIYIMSHASSERVYSNTVENFHVYNNTIDDARYSGYGLIRISQKNGDAGLGKMTNIKVINNLILNSPSSAGAVSGTATNLDIRNNGYWNNGTNAFSGATDKDRIISSPQLGASGKYEGYIPANEDFIDTGVYVGLPYKGSNPDIGAFEVGANLSPLIGVGDDSVADNSSSDNLEPPFLSIIPEQM